MKVPIVKRLCSISRASCLALAFCLFAPGMLYAVPANQIFILHSYSQEYPWTQGQHEGFIQTLTADAHVEPLVSTEYLDTKRRAYNETYASELARHLRLKYADYKPAAIYVTDDNALLFARDHLSRVFPGVPVFFSGINDYGVRSSLDPALFTGVFERKEVTPNIEWLLRVDVDANDLVFIGDGSNTYQAIESELRSELIPYRLRVTFIAEKRLARVLARLNDLPGKYIFLTTLGGMTDENDQALHLRDIMKSLALTGRIVISMEDAYIIEGVLGGYVTSGQKQGMNAARLLSAYQRGKPIVDLPPMLKSPNALIFDDRVLQQYGIDLPENLRSQAVLLHPRLGFYEQHRSSILGMMIGLAALLFLVVTVSLVIVSRKNHELSIARNSAESANALFNQLAEQSRTVHWEVNAEGVYTYVSPVSYEALGYRPEELVDKKHFYDLLHDDERDPPKTAAFEFFVRKEPFHDLENIIQTKAGRLIWVSTNGVPVLDDHGTFLGYRGSDSDITARKRVAEDLRESEEKFRCLIENAPDAIYVHADTRFIYLNQVAVNLFGAKTADQLIGSPVMERIDPSYHEMIKERHRLLYEEHRELSIFEQVYLRLDGSSVRVEAHALPITYGNKNAALAFVRDITERKQAEKKLQDTLESLRKAVGTTIQVMVSAVESRDPYTAGHQIRSADLARTIATEMGLPQEKIDGIRMAGSIHDIGKLSIPAEILSKPTKLSEIEFSLIKEHARQGFEMLKDVESPWPLAQIVYEHHERMNGSGYPRHLKGDDILIEARILAVADVVEAMASHRPYRPGLGIDAALKEIEKNKETLYDADVVDACLRLFREKGFKIERTRYQEVLL
jgi:PAS domain S-box-containing protein